MLSLIRVLPKTRLPSTSLFLPNQILINTFASQPSKERLAKEKAKEKERERKEREREKIAREKEREREKQEREKEKLRALREKQKAAADKLKEKSQKEKEKEKIQKEKEKAEREKEREKARKEKEQEKKNKEKEEKAQKKKEKAERPRRALSTYLLFSNSVRPAIKKSHPDLPVTKISQQIAAQWKSLSPDQKKKFEVQHLKAKEEHEKAMIKYKQTHPDPPKRPLSGYLLYTLDARPALVKKNPNLSVVEVAKQLGLQWSKLSDDQKKVYNDKSAQKKIPYEKEKAAYDKLKAKQAASAN